MVWWKQKGTKIGWFKCILSLACIVGFSICSSIAVKAENTITEGVVAFVVTETSLYREASTKSDVIESLQPLQAVKVVSQKGRFYKLVYQDTFAYMLCENVLLGNTLEEYVDKNKEQFLSNLCVTSDTAVLIDPSTGKAVKTVGKGECFAMLGKQGEFFQVSYQESTYYLYHKDVTINYYIPIRTFINVSTSVQLSEQVIEFSRGFLGNPYIWGGTDLVNGADCSGFVQSVFAEFKIDVPRTSMEQSKVGVEVALEDISVGDLIFYNRNGRIGHVAIYSGDGHVIEAKGAAYGIVEDDLDPTTIACVRRVLN